MSTCLVTKSCLTLLQPHGLLPARLFCPWDFPGKNNWSGLPFLSSGDLPDPGIKSVSPALAGIFLSTEPPGKLFIPFSSVQFISVAQSCLTLCDPMNHSTPGLPVHHQLPEFTQTHVHQVSDAIQPSHPLSSPSPPAPIPPSIKVFSNESALRIRWPKYWSFSLSISPSNEHPGLVSFRMDCWISLQSKGLSRVFFSTTVQRHQFFGTQLSSQSNSHIHT